MWRISKPCRWVVAEAGLPADMHNKLSDRTLIFGRAVEVIFFRVPSTPLYSSRQSSSLGNLQTMKVSSESKPVLQNKGNQKLQALLKS